jgi:exopolyphosphatase/pppGpp-phosphohydrolase
LTGGDGDRVDTSIPGAVTLRVILEQLGASEGIVARTGLREGLLVDELSRARLC